MKRPDWPCWPDLRVVVRVFPWHWKIRPNLYVDGVDGARGLCTFQWLAVTIEWWGDKPEIPLFPFIEQESTDGSA